MTEAEIEAGNFRLDKIDARYPLHIPHRYHKDLNAIARVEQKIIEKYPLDSDNELWCSCLNSAFYNGYLDTFCAEWGGDKDINIAVYAETEALARFEAALRLLNILDVK